MLKHSICYNKSQGNVMFVLFCLKVRSVTNHYKSFLCAVQPITINVVVDFLSEMTVLFIQFETKV